MYPQDTTQNFNFRVGTNYFYYFAQINSYKNMDCRFEILAITLLYKILISKSNIKHSNIEKRNEILLDKKNLSSA